MLRFRRPESFDASLLDTYRYLARTLSALLGCPATIQVRKATLEGPHSPIPAEDGGLLLPLAWPEGEFQQPYLAVPQVGASDKFCTKVANRFTRLCAGIPKRNKNAWDIKRELIIQEQYLWDNLVASLSLSGNDKYELLDIIAALRESLLFRYEGTSPETGVVITWNWHALHPELKALGGTIRKFATPFDLKESLRESKATHMLSDGRNCFLVASRHGYVTHWVSLPSALPAPPTNEWGLVPEPYKGIRPLLRGRDGAAVLSGCGDLYLFTAKHVVKWHHKCWHRVSGPSALPLLERHLTPDAAAKLLTVTVRMSSSRTGALFALTESPNELLRNGSAGLAGRFSGASLCDACAVPTEVTARLAAIDGCTVLRRSGEIVNAGVILNIPDEYASSGEGARAAAAAFASTFGAAIKVSHDGPIGLFENGRLVQQYA